MQCVCDMDLVLFFNFCCLVGYIALNFLPDSCLLDKVLLSLNSCILRKTTHSFFFFFNNLAVLNKTKRLEFMFQSNTYVIDCGKDSRLLDSIYSIVFM